MARQRLAGMGRRLVRRGERAARHLGSETVGMAQRAAHPKAAQQPPPDDITLARKVETEIFRPTDVPKGSINVNAENGIVYLRGRVDTQERIDELERQVRTIPGVRDVRNLLSLPGAPGQTS
ncbi:MAG: BON domain-containing protein [Thermoleophilaceae bacterium]|nr:BON domain-containing protein [Thermoleophilaceae bacterium]